MQLVQRMVVEVVELLADELAREELGIPAVADPAEEEEEEEAGEAVAAAATTAATAATTVATAATAAAEEETAMEVAAAET